MSLVVRLLWLTKKVLDIAETHHSVTLNICSMIPMNSFHISPVELKYFDFFVTKFKRQIVKDSTLIDVVSDIQPPVVSQKRILDDPL